MAKAIEINTELVKSFGCEIVLDKHCLPHISLCMGVVDDREMPQVKKILEGIARDLLVFELTAEGMEVYAIPGSKKVSGITIGNTPALQKLHEAVMQSLRHLLSYEVDASMLYDPPRIQAITLDWIKGYAAKHANPGLFHPHLTVGFGETDKFSFPIDFTANTLALCQLGNYCTCRQILSSYTLAV